mgnify:CR=1 FL=1
MSLLQESVDALTAAAGWKKGLSRRGRRLPLSP